jgi:6-phosphogluconolactonase
MIVRLLVFLLLLPAASLRAELETFYLGTYTEGTGSEGIYRATLDSVTGQLGPVKLAVATRKNPTFLARSEDGRFIYAAMSDAVAAFAVQPDGTLREINRQPSGANTCHLSLDHTGRELFSASYDDGTVSAFPLNADGSIGAEITRQKLTGSGPNHDRQLSPHAHSVNVDPENHFLFTCDLGSDRIWTFRIADGGKLVPADPPYIQCAPGSGPRHLVFSRQAALVVVANELGVSISRFGRIPATGALRLDQTLATINPGWPKGTGSGEIAIDPSGTSIYVSTRVTDRITYFSMINLLDGWSQHPISREQVIDSPVKFPRSIALDPSGRWLVVAGQTDNRVAVLKIDVSNGRLAPTDQVTTVDAPVCVLFSPTAK